MRTIALEYTLSKEDNIALKRAKFGSGGAKKFLFFNYEVNIYIYVVHKQMYSIFVVIEFHGREIKRSKLRNNTLELALNFCAILYTNRPDVQV